MKLNLDRSLKTPLYLQIRDQIRQLILTRQLSPGCRLPPERKLAAQLGVNRTTIVNAYHELAADGLIQAHVGKGSIVSFSQTVNQGPLPIQPVSWQNHYSSQAERMHNPVLASILDEIWGEDQISFALGAPAGEYYPFKELNYICGKLIQAGNWQAFAYGPTIGHPPLRESLAGWLALRGIRASAQNIMITSGSQQGLDLLAKIFLEPGDFIVMEEPSFLGAIGVFKTAGAHILTIPLDGEGLRTDILEQILARRRPKFIYTIPTYQNPTGTTMSLERRHQLLSLAYQFHVPIIEDDPYSELYYDQEPPPSLKSLDEHEHVIYLGTFSKILLPGLRIGWCAAPAPVLEQLSLAKQHVDLHTSTTNQWIMTEFCNLGLLDKHLSRVRGQYKRQRDTMLAALKEFAPPEFSWLLPSGGYYLWCQLPPGLNATSLLSKAAEKKVGFVPGNAFYVHTGGKNLLRLCFCHHTEAAIREGVYRLCTVLADLLSQPSQGKGARRHQYREPLV